MRNIHYFLALVELPDTRAVYLTSNDTAAPVARDSSAVTLDTIQVPYPFVRVQTLIAGHLRRLFLLPTCHPLR